MVVTDRALWSERCGVRSALNEAGLILLSEAALSRAREIEAKQARRSVRFGLDGFNLVVDHEVVFEIDERVCNGRRHVIPEGQRPFVPYYAIRIDGTVPKFHGWTFAAKVELLPGENMSLVHVSPVFTEPIPAQYRESDGRCDHCCTARRRSAVFVLHHEDGRWMQVGRSCIADFLGSHALASIEAMQWLGEIREMGDADDWSEGPRGRQLFRVMDVLATTVQVIASNGWMSRSRARLAALEYTPPTADLVLSRLAEVRKSDSQSQPEVPSCDPEKAQKEAEAALEWARALPMGTAAESDYLHNLAVLARQEHVDWRSFGLLCSIIPAHRRAQGQEVDGRMKRPTQHVGVVGKRSDFVLTVVHFMESEGNYGVQTRVKFADADGNQLIWWASGCPGVLVPDGTQYPRKINLEIGMQVECRATVKKHSVFRGTPQTEISRAVLSLIPQEGGKDDK